MIDLRITGCCEDCDFIDLEMVHGIRIDNGRTDYFVRCRHRASCKELTEEAERWKIAEDLARRAMDPEWQREHERIICGGADERDPGTGCRRI